MEKNDSFQYTYSAAQQQEIEDIRKKYLPKEEDKMQRLRALHAVPTRKAQTSSLTVGILGTLIMGTGMSLAMTDIGTALGNWAMVLGIGIGLAGMVLVALAYPLYNRVLRKWREKIAPQILQLTDDLLK